MLKIQDGMCRYHFINMDKYDYFMLRDLNEAHPDIDYIRNVYNEKRRKYQTLMTDLSFSSQDDNAEMSLVVNDEKANIQSPEWISKDGKGYVIESIAGQVDISIICKGKELLCAKFRSKDQKDRSGNRYDIAVNLLGLRVNETETISNPRVISYTNYHEVKLEVKDNDRVAFSVEWQPLH